MADRSITIYPGGAATEPCPYGDPFPDLPTNFLLAAGTASGKTQIILNIVLKYYSGMFQRVWIFSPSIFLDPQYKSLRDVLDKMTDQKREPTMFEEFSSKKVGEIMDDQRAIVESCRKRSVKPPQVCLILDDLGDSPDIVNSRKGAKSGGSWLTTLACRSRHLCTTWICSVQKLNQAGLVIRANTRCLCVWRLRNFKEIESLCEEMSGYYDKKTVMDLYDYATAEPYSFMFCRLDAKTKRDVFWLRFESRLTPQTEEEDKDDGGLLGSKSVDGSTRQPVAQQRPGPSQVRPAGTAAKGRGKGLQDSGGNRDGPTLRPRKPAL